jgi:hypothetical protein
MSTKKNAKSSTQSAGLSLAVDWKTDMVDSKWAEILKAAAEASFRAGIGGELAVTFRIVENARVQWIIKGSAVAGLGGKADIACELDFKEGADLMWYILDSVNYHKVFETEGDTFDLFTVAKLVLLFNPATGPAVIAAKGASLLAEYVQKRWTWWDDGPQVEKIDERVLLKKIVSGSESAEVLMVCHPETLGMALKLIMQTQEDSDYQAILNILNSTALDAQNDTKDDEPYHKLRCTIRSMMGDEEIKKGKDEALRKGVQRITDFFSGTDNDDYQSDLDKILRKIK